MTPIPGQRMPAGSVPGYLTELTPPDSTFDQVEAATVDIHLATFGEWIWYKPETGGPMQIMAIVDRHGEEIQANPRTRKTPVTIAVKPDPDDGIDPDAYTMRDEIEVRTSRTGTTQITLRIARAVHSDGGLITFEAI